MRAAFFEKLATTAIKIALERVTCQQTSCQVLCNISINLSASRVPASPNVDISSRLFPWQTPPRSPLKARPTALKGLPKRRDKIEREIGNMPIEALSIRLGKGNK